MHFLNFHDINCVILIIFSDTSIDINIFIIDVEKKKKHPKDKDLF